MTAQRFFSKVLGSYWVLEISQKKKLISHQMLMLLFECPKAIGYLSDVDMLSINAIAQERQKISTQNELMDGQIIQTFWVCEGYWLFYLTLKCCR